MRLNGYQGSITSADGFFYRDGKTEYRILIPAQASESECFAAQELTAILAMAGVAVETVNDEGVTADPSACYVALGNTVYFRSLGVKLTQQEFKFDGYIIESVGNTYVIKGVGDTGTCFGVYGFCEYLCGYRFYTPEEMVIDALAANKEFHIKDIPTFLGRNAHSRHRIEPDMYDFRLRNNGEFSKREAKHGEGCPWSSLHDMSNARQILDYTKYREIHPDWFYLAPEHENANPPFCYPQICYSKGLYDDEFFNTFVHNLIHDYIIPEKDKMFFMLGMSDNPDFCNCEQCQKEVAAYTKSGLSMRFVNKVADAVEAWRKENAPDRVIYLLTFAYLSTFDAPAVEKDGAFFPIDGSVVARDNVIVQFAPIHANYLYPMLDPEHNASSRTSFLGWKAVAKNMCVWDYRQDFHDNAFPYPSSVTAQQNLEDYHRLGMVEVFNQNTSLSIGPPFVEMDDFARARLQWNIKENYDELKQEFMQAFYKDSAPFVLEYHKAVVDYYKVMEARGWTVDCHHGALHRPYLHTMEDMYAFKAILDKALAAAPNQTVYDRVNYLTLFYKFTLLTCFATKLQKEEALALVDDARAIAKKRGLDRFMHKHSTDDMLDDCRDVILGIKTDAERRFPWRTLDHKLPF